LGCNNDVVQKVLLVVTTAKTDKEIGLQETQQVIKTYQILQAC